MYIGKCTTITILFYRVDDARARHINIYDSIECIRDDNFRFAPKILI